MLRLIDDLPAGVTGVQAMGTVSKEDYQDVLRPLLDQARREGRRVRFLYQLGPEFEKYTGAAAWEDTRIGVKYLRLFERCAVVSDVSWVQAVARAIAAVMPCPVRVFENQALQQAVDWLSQPAEPKLEYRILPHRGVLVVEPHGKLEAEDFDALEASVDAYVSSADLGGLVVHARAFPGWENLGSALRHMQFVRDHHREIQRVAWAVDGKLAALAPELGKHFVRAEMRKFSADELEDAIAWASGERMQQSSERTARPPEVSHTSDL